MIAALMVYASIASGLLLLGAMAIENATRGSRLPRRLVWSSSMTLAIGLVTFGGLSLSGTNGDSRPEMVAEVLSVGPEGAYSAQAPSSVLTAALPRLEGLLKSPVLLASRLDIDGRWLGFLWITCSGALFMVGIASVLRYRRLRRNWPIANLDGHLVRVSPASGPAVMGLFRPEIVVPRWLVEAPIEKRRLALAHESEHIRARDGVLLAAGWVVLALFPWNLAVWWMLFRLRLAIEIDCDQRVLACGAERRQYGSMLIDLSAHSSGLSLAVPALAGFPSNLERRLVAMTTDLSRRSRTLRALVGALGSVAVLAACGAELPTAAEIEALDVATVESQARVLGIDSTTFFVDGVQVSSEQARALAPAQIASIQVVRGQGTAEAGGSVQIRTKAGASESGRSGNALEEVTVAGYGAATGQAAESGSAPSASALPEVTVVGYGEPPSSGDEYVVTVGFARPTPEAAPEAQGIRVNAGGAGDPLYLIDGVAATDAEFNRLAPSSIESISVLKGGTATAQYTDPRARNGVVLVVTKSASR